MLNNDKIQQIKRGNIYIADMGQGIGSEIYGIHHVIIIQNNLGNMASSTVIVALITFRLKKAMQETHVVLDKDNGLDNTAIIQFEQLRSISKDRLIEYIGRVKSRNIFKQIKKAYRIVGGYTWSDKDEFINNIELLDENVEGVVKFKELYRALIEMIKNKEL